MPAFLTIIASPAKVTMLLICILGSAFMMWFLVGLFTDRIRMRARYVVRFKSEEDRSDEAWKDRLYEEPVFDESKSDKRWIAGRSRSPVQGFRIEQRF